MESTNKSIVSMKANVSNVSNVSKIINPMDDDPDKSNQLIKNIILILLGLPLIYYIKLYYGGKYKLINN